MKNSNSRTSSKLAGYVWDLKDRGVQDFGVPWDILARPSHFNPVTRKCMLCLKEKLLSCKERGPAPLTKEVKYLIPVGTGPKTY